MSIKKDKKKAALKKPGRKIIFFIKKSFVQAQVLLYSFIKAILKNAGEI